MRRSEHPIPFAVRFIHVEMLFIKIIQAGQGWFGLAAFANQTPRRGFSRDVSPLGMCLGVDVPERIGALLRVELRQLDGQSIGATIGRVVWCKPTRDGRHWIGLDLLCEPDGVRSKWHQRMLEGSD